ncbi:MAG: methane monooxygenase/ammonia monooxygenase subunit B [Acidimicrobiia bacterium]
MNLKKLFAGAVLGLTTLGVAAPAAYAHGERSQEAFLRMRTVAWQDVVFSGGERDAEGDIVIAQGEQVKMQGVARLMNSWPDTLAAGNPEIGYINIATQGPVVGMLERTVNGVSAPGRLEVARGNYYNFDMTLMGRRNGRWHVHPTFAVKGAGTVLGPGAWIEVKKSPNGFTSPVKLYNGETINIENYGLNFIWGLQVIGFLLGVIWLVWWTGGSQIGNAKWGPKWHRTVTNPAVTLAIPLNDDGVAVGLNKKADHRFCNIMALVTALFLLGGWIYAASAWPVKIPQQVVQFEPPKTELDATAPMAEINPQRASLDRATRELAVNVEVTNISDSPIQVKEFLTSTLQFYASGSSPKGEAGYQDEMTVSPSSIAPGQKATVTMTMSGERFDREHLLPLGESQLTISGLLRFQDASGKTSAVELEEPLQPNFE